MPTVILYWSRGRSEAQKANVAGRITDALVNEGGARREDVLIIFQNIEPGDSARAGQITGAPVTNDQPQDELLVNSTFNTLHNPG